MVSLVGCTALRFVFDEEYNFTEAQNVGSYGVVLKKGSVVVVPNSLAHYLKDKPYFEVVEIEIKEKRVKKEKTTEVKLTEVEDTTVEILEDTDGDEETRI